MMPRFLLLQVPRLPPNESLDSSATPVYRSYRALVKALVDHRPSGNVDVELAAEARALMGAAKLRWQQLAIDVADEVPRHAERVAKLVGQAARLAVLLMMIEAASKPSRVDKVSGELAPQWVDVSAANMRDAIALLDLQLQHDLAFARSLIKVEVAPGLKLARGIARWVLREAVASFNQRLLVRSFEAWNARDADARTKRDALAILVELGWITPSAEPWFSYDATLVHGVTFKVNPAAHAMFVARAELARREAAALKVKIAADVQKRRQEADHA
jgi:hypothetical protein